MYTTATHHRTSSNTSFLQSLPSPDYIYILGNPLKSHTKSSYQMHRLGAVRNPTVAQQRIVPVLLPAMSCLIFPIIHDKIYFYAAFLQYLLAHQYFTRLKLCTTTRATRPHRFRKNSVLIRTFDLACPFDLLMLPHR